MFGSAARCAEDRELLANFPHKNMSKIVSFNISALLGTKKNNNQTLKVASLQANQPESLLMQNDALALDPPARK